MCCSEGSFVLRNRGSPCWGGGLDQAAVTGHHGLGVLTRALLTDLEPGKSVMGAAAKPVSGYRRYPHMVGHRQRGADWLVSFVGSLILCMRAPLS